MRVQVDYRRTQRSKNRMVKVDGALVARPWHPFSRTIQTHDSPAQRHVRMWHACFGRNKVANVSGFDFFLDQPMITVKVDAVIAFFGHSISNESRSNFA